MLDMHNMTDDQFDTYRTAAVPYINANSVRLTVSAGNITTLGTTDTAYSTVWGLYGNPATRTTIITHTKTDQRDAFMALLSSIYNDIPKSVIIQADEDVLHITANRADPTQTPVMTVAPDITVHSKGGGHYEATFKNPLTPATKKFPKGQAFIVVLQIITDSGVAPSPFGPYTGVLFSSDGSLNLSYASTYFGKQANIMCQYLNNRGEAGPLSVFTSYLIGQ